MTDDLLAPTLTVVADVLSQAVVVNFGIDADDIAEMGEDSLKLGAEVTIDPIERCCYNSQLFCQVYHLPNHNSLKGLIFYRLAVNLAVLSNLRKVKTEWTEYVFHNFDNYMF